MPASGQIRHRIISPNGGICRTNSQRKFDALWKSTQATGNRRIDFGTVQCDCETNVTQLLSEQVAAWARGLRWQHEVLTRTVELFHPVDEDQYLSALRWFVECGEERDVALIEEAGRMGKYHSEEATALVREAPSRIRARESRDPSRRSTNSDEGTLGPFAQVADEAAALVNSVREMRPKQLHPASSIPAGDVMTRRVELVKPQSEAQFRQALWWASACGDALDLAMIEALEGSRKYRGEELDELVEQAKRRISRRLQARDLLAQLLTARANEKFGIADQILRFGISSRGTGAPRGNLLHSAETRVPSDDLDGVAALMEKSVDPEFRQQVALVLGEWGGEHEAQKLVEAVQREGWQTPDQEQFALHCVSALKSIGGRGALQALCDLLRNGSVPIQLSTLNAIEELATGGSETFGESVPHFDPPRGRYVRRQRPAQGTEQLVNTLKMTLNEAASPAVRARSKEILDHVLT
jgi:hypothetical protein